MKRKKESFLVPTGALPKSDNLISPSVSVCLSVCVLCTLCILAFSKVQNACMLILASSFSHMQTFRNNRQNVCSLVALIYKHSLSAYHYVL